MLPAFSPRKLIAGLLSLTIGLQLYGCSPARTETISLGDWISAVNERAGFEGYEQKTPYFMNVTQGMPCYDAVQSAVEWEILDPQHEFQPDAALTREWAAYTLMHLSGREIINTSNQKIRDISRSEFQKEIQTAVASGLMKLDAHDRFQPAEEMERSDAIALLEQAASYRDSMKFEQAVSDIEWNENLRRSEAEPQFYDEQRQIAEYSSEENLQEGDLVTVHGQDGLEQSMLVDHLDSSEEDGTIQAHLRQPLPEEVIDSMEIADTFEADLTQAELIETPLPEQHSHRRMLSINPIRNKSAGLKSGHFQYGGYEISYGLTASGISASISKTAPAGIRIEARAAISSIKPSFHWKMTHGKIEDGYFRIDFTSTESLSAKRSDSRNAYANLKNIDPAAFLASASAAFSPQADQAELSVPLCTVRIPIPEMPLVSITARIELHLRADGRAELSLSQNHSAGMEIYHGHMRRINQHSNSSKNMIQASVSLTSGIYFGLDMERWKIANVGLECGAKAEVKSTVHLYGKDGSHQKVAAALPPDYLSKASDGNEHVLICGDISAHWVMDMKLNSSGTLANRFGFGRTFDILNSDNGILIPGMKTHIENFQFVDACTRKDRPAAKKAVKMPDTRQFKLRSYSMIGSIGETRKLEVLSMPEGYSAGDLQYHSSDSSVASIDSSGFVTGHQSGSTVLTVQTKDGKYRISCSYLVRQSTQS